MDFEVVWTDLALTDSEEAVAYIARHNPEAAERVGNQIVDHVDVLQTFSLIGPTYPRGARGDRREVVCGNHRIFYRVFEARKRAKIPKIWHGARGILGLS